MSGAGDGAGLEVRIAVRINAKLMARIDKAAEFWDCGRSQAIRMLAAGKIPRDEAGADVLSLQKSENAATPSVRRASRKRFTDRPA